MSVQTRLIDYTHEKAVLQAEFAWDDATGNARPGILVAPNWAGRSPLDGEVARRLAASGYAGFALDVYGKGILGSSREENAANMQPLLDDRSLLQARLNAALSTMAAQPEVDALRMAIIGYCFGGLCALDMARRNFDIQAAVSFHGLFSKPDNAGGERIKPSVLILHGWDDPMATPDDVLAITKELTDAAADWQMHAYGGTMHAFTNRGANDPEHGTVYNATADKRSWQAALNFLDERLKNAAD